MSQALPQDFFGYFNACHQLNHQGNKIENIFASKYKYNWFVKEKEALFVDRYPVFPYDSRYAESLQKTLTLEALEKELFYGLCYVLSKQENSISRDNRLCAPLILFPASISLTEEGYFISIDRDNPQVNRSLLHQFILKNENISKGEIAEKILALVPKPDFHADLRLLLEEYFHNIHSSELLLFPRVWNEGKIRKFFKEQNPQENEFTLIPAAGTLLVEKSQNALRIGFDLEQMIQKKAYNNCLNDLLTNPSTKATTGPSIYDFRLNVEQQQALKNSQQFHNSIIIGPPGTGKSYTITAIVANAIMKNQSVLVVSKSKHAVEVIRQMMISDYDLKDYLIHTSGHQYKSSLKAKLRKCLNGIHQSRGSHIHATKLEQQSATLQQLEEKFERITDREQKLGSLSFSEKLSTKEKIQKWWWRNNFRNHTEIWEILEASAKVTAQLEKDIGQYSKEKIRRTQSANVNKYRKSISAFYDAIDSQSFTDYKERVEKIDHQKMLKIFPLWLAHLNELNGVLPLQPDLFDLVIIDEATQCDVASALPALYRAKKAVVVGDPYQLRHYSFISQMQQFQLREKFNIPNEKIYDFRNRSILDLFISKAQQQEQVSFLREHFRSTPSLINFSNEAFYEGALKVIRSTPEFSQNAQWAIIRTDGHRNEKGVNEKEAEALIQELKALVQKYQNEKQPPSFGIISPFNSQVVFLNKLLKNNFELETIKKFQIFCGTPFHFQGSERDIILFSFGLCNQSHAAAFQHAGKAEVLNVGITRAKSFQYIFQSFDPQSIKGENYIKPYISFLNNYKYQQEETEAHDAFQLEVATAISKNQLGEAKMAYPLAGMLLDILWISPKQAVFIDLIGYPGDYQGAFSMERYKTLERSGIKVFPLQYSYWNKNKADVISRLRKTITP
ncbi:DEAD/DEAH box helicase [Persicobacter diffluens]|uniref:AAA family ATPase n=1 Tax=Persicobacter diffluens TaxID=981 RepID=A0AAN4W3K4_9BACT|nr:hypothetical protein PEDI_45600 [Persicobacter diffluens]